jgi:hypothetical protein
MHICTYLSVESTQNNNKQQTINTEKILGNGNRELEENKTNKTNETKRYTMAALLLWGEKIT